MAGNTNASTLTLQDLIDYARTFPWCKPIMSVVGFSNEPALSIANDVVKEIISKANPWKWNSFLFVPLLTQPYQQDYPTSVSQNVLGWLESATISDINNPQVAFGELIAQPPLTCVQNLLPSYTCNIPTKVCWIPNRVAQLGKWPGTGILYQNPLVSAGGGPGNNPFTAILDPNGNIQVVTTYGTTGNVTPIWPAAGAQAGTNTPDGSVIWTVQDPNGVALRLDFLATFGSNVWQINVKYQQKAPNIMLQKTTAPSQITFSPIPDDIDYLMKKGFLAYCYKHAGKPEFGTEYAQYLATIQDALGANDRELQEFGFYPHQGLQSSSSGSAGPFGYPGWPGWV